MVAVETWLSHGAVQALDKQVLQGDEVVSAWASCAAMLHAVAVVHCHDTASRLLAHNNP